MRLVRATALKTDTEGLFAGAEDWPIAPDQAEAMKGRREAAGNAAKFKIYLGAPRGFLPRKNECDVCSASQQLMIAIL